MGRVLNSDIGTVEVKGDVAEGCSGIAAYLLNGAVDRMLLVGPVVWRPSDGTSSRQWYFTVVGCDQVGAGTTAFDEQGRQSATRCQRSSAQPESGSNAVFRGVFSLQFLKHEPRQGFRHRRSFGGFRPTTGVRLLQLFQRATICS